MEQQYLSAIELAKWLGIEPKTIRNNSFRIIGRVKIGGALRFDKNLIAYTPSQGKDIYADGGRK